MPVTEENIYRWLSHPQEMKPGSKMPNFIFSNDTLKALSHYLGQLK